ncbi:MAG: NAD(+)--rifampin ADP-ribosyltransferase [candidate division FCPU426 bacterium]
MEFGPNNKVVKLCIQGMAMEENGMADEAAGLFLQAWNDATDDFEKFLAAHFLARCQEHALDRLKWLETALHFAQSINDDTVKSAFPPLFSAVAKCYEELGDPVLAWRNHQLAQSFDATPSDKGPFYHGTKADLQVGDLLTPGRNSNYSAEVIMNHVYFTALINGAGLAAELTKGENKGRVYMVELTGPFENDPNVTNSKFPGNPTRSYRSQAPLRIIAEVPEWKKQTPKELKNWREKLAAQKGKIIN